MTDGQQPTRKLGSPRSLAVLRALQLGDLLCAVPAWRALRQAYPGMHIALIGLPWAKDFVARFHRYFDEFIEFPGYPGLPEREADIERIPDFLNAMRSRRFDLMMQMQGSGHYVNEVVALCGARRVAGYYQSPEFCPDPDLFLSYPDGIPEVRRHLRLMNFLGIPDAGEHLEFPITAEDERAWLATVHWLEPSDALSPSYACVHPGGRRPANRWAPTAFAAAADRLAAEGLQIVLTGTASEQDLGEAVAAAMKSRPVNLIGRTTLGSLAVLLRGARLLLSNDTGLSHLAAALSVPSVIVCIGSDPIRWSPLDRRRHRMLVGRQTTPEAVLSESRDLLHPERQLSADPLSSTAAVSSAVTVSSMPTRRLRILTWHVHGNYLYYLSRTPHDFFLPIGRNEPGYAGCAPGFPWPPNLHEVPVRDLSRTPFDCILFQSRRQYLVDQYEMLSDAQRALPRLYLEHDPPQDHPTDQLHPVNDPDMLLVHVTHFNRLMWNNGLTPACVIEHGVVVPEHLSYQGDIEKGLVVVNHLQRRGRRLGADLFDYFRARVPLDLVGMDSVAAGGLGEIGHDLLPELMCRYRFVLHPIRFTSLGLALCEAMSLGIPPVALATTEAPTVIRDGESGYISSDVDQLIKGMKRLLSSRDHAQAMGAEARRVARSRFGIERFARDWDRTLREFVRDRTAGRQTGGELQPSKMEVLR